jgi:hypothetical protein
MDDLTMLRELGREFDPPTGGPTLATRRRVLAATRPGARPAARNRLRWVAPGLAAAMAGGLALTFLLPSTPTIPDQVAPGRAAAGRHALDARHVLLAAADTARADGGAAPPADAFVYSRSLIEYQGRRTEREAWLSVDGRRDGAVVPTGETELVRLPGCDGTQAGDQPGRPCQPTPAYRSDLPADADGAYRLLTKENSRPSTAFKDGSSLLQEGQVSPASAAAVLEALSRLPGITELTSVRTLSGRAGVGVVLTAEGGQQGIVLDPVDHRLLGGWIGSPTAAGAVGTVDYAWEGLAKGVVTEVGLRPDGSRRPVPVAG